MPELKLANLKLSRQIFFIILGLMVIVFSVIYAYSVPFIKTTVFEIERNASRLVLNNVFEIASQMNSNIEGYRAQLLKSQGVYPDNLEQKISQRRQDALQQLRLALQKIKIAKTGYLFVFDSKSNMLIHPNANIDGLRFNERKNPLTNQLIGEELIKVADTGEELHYLWDKPSDPGNYRYEKLSLVRYMPEFDWYICSSVYLDELNSSSDTLSNRLLMLAVITILLSTLLAWFLVKRITRPLSRLVDTAQRVSQGDLSATSGIHSKDEFGLLATSFDGMVKHLKNNIDNLDDEVKSRTEELLETNARAQRMHAVGQLAGGLAHDYNNLLSIILGNLLLARERYHGTSGLDELLTPAIRATRRGAEIAQRLLTFSRRQPLKPEFILIRPLLRDVIQLLHGFSAVTLKLNPPGEGTENTTEAAQEGLYADPAHLENALINLALNAQDAMPNGGELNFYTQTVVVTDRNSDGTDDTGSAVDTIPDLITETDYPDYDEAVLPGKYICIKVIDTGTGFSELARSRAFEPFFTTKSGGENSGLGLSMVYGLVKQSKGYLRINNRDNGSGACISLLFPAVQAVQSLPDTNPIHPQSTANTVAPDKLFLLVEDDAEVRKVIRNQLVQAGIHVIEAGGTAEAQVLIDKLPGLDGMISDIMLQGKSDGWQLAEKLYQKNAQSMILLISGYANETAQPASISGRFPLLQKPFDQQTLQQAIQRATHSGRET